MSHLLILAGSLAVSILVTPLVRSVAQRSGWLDVPATRKVKARALPRLGGVAIGAAFYAAFLAATLLRPDAGGGAQNLPPAFGPLLVGGALMLVLGLIDDVIELRARVKFIGQVVIAIAVVVLGLVINRMETPFGPVVLGPLAGPLTVVWLVAVVNALNLIDGLDGLASGVTLTACGALFFVSLGQSEPLTGLVLLALAGAVMGFLVYNFHPASIIMGDSGAMFLGFMLAGAAVLMSDDPARPVQGAVPILALGLPAVDTAFAVIRRSRAGLPIFRADREHIHHQLMVVGLSHRSAVVALYAVSLAFGALAVVAGLSNGLIAGVILILTIMLAAVLAARLHARAGTSPAS